MHEFTLARAIWRDVLENVRARPHARLTEIRLVVGTASGADPESLAVALEEMIRTGPWPDARLRIRRPPLELRCEACDRLYRPRGADMTCPECGRAEAETVAGGELTLESLQVEVPDEA